MGLALYRKYRSKSLDEIVGQSHITDILRRAIETGNVAHAYLLTGPRGVGKTSIARILAHEINKLPYTDESTHLDIIEIDAASNSGVDDIRDLRERVQIAPTSAPKKIYIIDEVHMLSKPAFNALLKTLEEPPEHVVFILATTDVEKLPTTIVSRTQRFNFRAISVEDTVTHLTHIAHKEKISIDDEALRLIAEHSAGSFRDSISMLDQLRSSADKKITRQTVEAVMGLAPQETIDDLLTAYQAGDIATVVTILNHYEQRGTSAASLVRQLISTINARVIDEPGYLALLDRLLDSSKSAWPYVKLMTALTSRRHTSELTPELPKLATPKPKKAPSPEPTPVVAVDTAPEDSPSRHTGEMTDEVPPASQDQAFAWDQFIALVREQSSGAATLLLQCAYHYDGTTLTIYAGKKFHKTQIDKSHPTLVGILRSLALGAQEIVVVATAKPPENSQTAAVLDIMGGGKEVSL
jgi:DNA polymerase-3 subunit gamma/tau